MVITPRLTTTFSEDAFTFILNSEDFAANGQVYSDTVGVPTMGYGYAMLVTPGNGSWVRKKTLIDDMSALGITLTNEQLLTLTLIAQALESGLVTLASDLSNGLGDQTGTGDIRAISEAEGRVLFNLELQRSLDAVKSRFIKFLGGSAGNALFTSLENSQEMVALASLAYNAQTLIGENLVKALAAGDRAEAWYQIRYESNLQGNLTDRRYRESDQFSLYNTGIDADEATNIYRMFTLHRGDIFAQEQAHDPTNPNAGSTRIDSQLAGARNALLASINAENGLSLDPGKYASTNIYVDPGRTRAGQTVNPNNSFDLNSIRFDSLHNEIVSHDILMGEGGADLLTSGLGDDVLIGGQGNDVLAGGGGQDVYVYRTGDGADSIRDTGHDGSVVYNGIALTGAGAIQWIDPQNPQIPAWRAEIAGHVFYFRLHEPHIDASGVISGNLWIQEDGAPANDRIVVEGFETTLVNGQAVGDLGLSLPLNPLVMWYTTVNGLSNPFGEPDPPAPLESIEVSEGMMQGLAIALNVPAQEGQILRIASADPHGLAVVTGAETLQFVNGQIDLQLTAGQTQVIFSLISQGDIDSNALANLSATLLDAQDEPIGASSALAVTLTARNEEIAAPSTTNTIDAFDPNSVQGPAGSHPADFYGTNQNDLILTRSLIGGGGSAIALDEQGGNDDLRGGDGADQLFGGSGNDFVSGAGYIDFLYGDAPWDGSSNGDDVLAGGSGSDLLVGGAGNDQLWATNQGNQATAVADAGAQASLPDRGDFLLGAEGNDFVVGSGGFDVIAGGAGEDALIGGGGDDLLVGDRSYDLQYNIPIALIDTGAFDWGWSIVRTPTTQPDGSITYSFSLTDSAAETTITEVPGSGSQGGADRLYGGAGNDGIFGEFGDDFADGGDGDDGLSGGVGNDTLLGGNGVDMLVGGDSDDVTGHDFLDGGADNDTLLGGHADDVLYGGSGDDHLYGDDSNDAFGGDDYLNGEDGNDSMVGGADADALYGGAGNDTMYGDSASTAAERHGADFMDGGAGQDVLVGDGGDDTLLGGDGDDQLFGEASDTPVAVHGEDHLDGGAGDDILAGEGGADRLFGGYGNDQLFGESSQTPEAVNADDFLDGGEGNDLLFGGGGSDTLLGGEGDDQLRGDLQDTPTGIAGDDYLDGGAGDDALWGYQGVDTLIGGNGVDVLDGGDGDDVLLGGDNGDLLLGGAGNDVLRGGLGADSLQGGAGDDVYLFQDLDLQIDNGLADGIIDTLGSNRVVFENGILAGDLTVTLGSQPGSILLSDAFLSFGLVVRDAFAGSISTFEFSNGETLTAGQLIGRYLSDAADQTSSDDDAVLFGGIRNDVLTALGDNSAMSGGHGNDTLTGGSDARTSYVFESGDGADVINDEGNQTVAGQAMTNRLLFGGGIDMQLMTLELDATGTFRIRFEGTTDSIRLQHFTATDVLFGARTIDEFQFENDDTVTWGDLVARLGITVLSITAGGSVTGTNVDDRLLGSAGDDVLNAGLGSDTYLFGHGSGNDTINNDDSAPGDFDRLELAADVSTDEVQLYRAGDALVLALADSSDTLLVNSYFSSGSLDAISFADGTIWDQSAVAARAVTSDIDAFVGTAGNDTFFIDNPLDTVAEQPGGGTDTIEAVISYALPDNVENMTLLGSADLSAIGNTLSNVLTGNAGNNVLDGRGGSDTLIGGTGNDTYIVSQAGVVIIENPQAGTDEVRVSGLSSYTLGANVENLRANGAGSQFDPRTDLIGNALDNTIISNDSAHRLDGGAGADTLIGNGGDDVYVVDNTGDVVIEAGSGTDRVESSISYVLPDFVEDLVLTGTAAISGTGNALNNQLTASGNSAANVLAGGAGDDLYLIAGSDVVMENAGEGSDTIEIVSGTPTNPFNLASYANVENLRVRDAVNAATLLGNGADNVLTGNSWSNWLDGGAGNDTLIGGGTSIGLPDSDTLVGGTGNDLLMGGIHGDTYLFARGDGQDIISDDDQRTQGLSDAIKFTDSTIGIEDLVLTSTGADLVITLADGPESITVSNHFVQFGEWNSAIEGIMFADGSFWDRTALASRLADSSNVATEAADTIVGGSSADTFDALDGDDTVSGGDGDDELHGGTGNDNLFGNQGDDTLDGGDGNDQLYGQMGNDSILAGAGRDNVVAGDGNDFVDGGDADDMIDGGTGVDTLLGGSGNDIVMGFDGNDSILGEDGHDTLDGGAGDDELSGGEGDDNLSGRIGNDTLYGGNGNDTLLGEEGDDILVGGAGTDRLEGYSGNDIYHFDRDSGNATIYEWAGLGPTDVDAIEFSADIAPGEVVVSRSGINLVLTLAAAGRQITVGNFFDQADPAGLEFVRFANGTTWDAVTLQEMASTITGTSGADTLTGSAFDDRIFGLDGADILNGLGGNDLLDGGTGADQMTGGAGNDTFVVDDVNDTVSESSNGGTDLIRSYLTRSLASTTQVENLTLLGTGDINATGNSLGNLLTGNSGANVLDGGSGSDTMIGGAGNDTYVVAQAGDIVTESANEGLDLVQASITYTLGADVENLTLTGSSGLNGTGNGLDNALTGNSGSNTLTGGAGNDTLNGGSAGTDGLVGGTGNDTYIVARTTGITITENAGEGTDTVQASVTYTLGGNLENLTLTGSSALNGTGNGLDNTLIGNGGSNTLTGSGGNDTLDAGSAGTDSLVGGTGNDTYIIGRTTGITVTENANEGTDAVQSSVTYTIGNNVENLTLTGSSAINGTGNTLGNALIGNDGNNTLTGAAGNDTLKGGNGADIYSYSSGHGADTIDNSSTDSAQDRLNVTNLTRAQVTFTQSGNDLLMTRNGTPSDSVRVTNWFSVPGNQLDFVQFTDQTLTSAQINALFGSGLLSSAESIAPPPRLNDQWDRSLAMFVDAMNHFGGHSDLIVDHFGAAAREVYVDGLTAGRQEGELGLRHQSNLGERRQLAS